MIKWGHGDPDGAGNNNKIIFGDSLIKLLLLALTTFNISLTDASYARMILSKLYMNNHVIIINACTYKNILI